MQRHELYFIAFMFTMHEYYRADVSFCKPVFGKVDLQNDLFMFLHVIDLLCFSVGSYAF